MEYEKIRRRVVDYIKAGEKPPEKFSLGFEVEHFVVDNETLESISYFGKDGIGETLEDLERQGFTAHREGSHILTMERGNFSISTEPGSQFEIAIQSNYKIRRLEEQYLCLFDELISLFEKKNQSLVTLGYHPNTCIDDIKILPKQRYDYMYRYFNNHGTMSHHMMKGTCALQVTIDFQNEEDFRKKYFVANCLSPIFYSLFDNSYIFEKKPQEKHNTRQTIWENTDPNRSGLFSFAFDPDVSYEKYADKIIQTPLIFIERNGEQIYCGEKTLADIMTEDDTDELIFHALSIVFPDVRIKQYIEIRMMDEVCYPLNFACIAFIKGLFYNEHNLNTLVSFFQDTTLQECQKAKDDSRERGVFARYKNQTILELAKKFIRMAKDALGDEAHYLEPLEQLVSTEKSPRDQFKEVYDLYGLRNAVQLQTITRELFNDK